MSVVSFVPRYSQPTVGRDESHSKAIVDILDPHAEMPQHCGRCKSPASFENPLMMEPLGRFDNGLPRGTLYAARCSRCKERAAGRRR